MKIGAEVLGKGHERMVLPLPDPNVRPPFDSMFTIEYVVP